MASNTAISARYLNIVYYYSNYSFACMKSFISKDNTSRLLKASDNKSSKASANDPTHVIIERVCSIEIVNTTVASNISHVDVMAEITSRVAPSSNRTALAIEASLGQNVASSLNCFVPSLALSSSVKLE